MIIPDASITAWLATATMELLPVSRADTDFARFPGGRWTNPLL